jgi:hypothetical protein
VERDFSMERMVAKHVDVYERAILDTSSAYELVATGAA